MFPQKLKKIIDALRLIPRHSGGTSSQGKSTQPDSLLLVCEGKGRGGGGGRVGE